MIRLVVEVHRTALAQKVTSLLLFLVAGAMSAAVHLTAGSAIAAAQQLTTDLEAAGSRQYVLTDVTDSGAISAVDVDVLGNTPLFDSTLALSTPQDASPPYADDVRIPLWQTSNDWARALTLVDGRLPRQGSDEVLVSIDAMATLGWTAPVGALRVADGSTLAVVGSYRPSVGFEVLATGAVNPSPKLAASNYDSLIAISAVGASSDVTGDLLLQTIAPFRNDDITVRSPEALSDLPTSLRDNLQAYAQQTLLLTIGSGGILVVATVTADVLLRRRDVGRRRALGAKRTFIQALVVGRSAYVSLAGGATGALCAATYLDVGPETYPGVEVSLYLLGLVVLTAGIAAVLPAVAASLQDPVRVLRTP